MKRLSDHLIGNVRPVEIARVDMIDTGRDRFPQNGERGLAVLGGPKTPGPANCMAP
jgi:hypothetical protein